MSQIKMNAPRVITVEYYQDRDDKDYGCCLWARFYFDLDNYSLSIESDCGSYGYTWTRTPQIETFLHLCNRFDYGYLLDKLSRQTRIDGDATWDNLLSMINDLGIEDDLALYANTDYDVLGALEIICKGACDDRDFVDSIESEIRYTPLENVLESYDIWQSLDHDYPINAKTICNIFVKEIMPWLAVQEELTNEFKKIKQE